MSDKYSLLVMRDSNEKVRKLRISCRKAKILLFSALFLFLLGIAGIVFAIFSIRGYLEVSSKFSAMREDLAKANVQLQRLSNMEKILQNSEATAHSQGPMDTGSAAGNAPPSPNLPKSPETLDATAVVATVFPESVNATKPEHASPPLSQSSATPLSQSSSAPHSQNSSIPLSQGSSIPLSQGSSAPLAKNSTNATQTQKNATEHLESTEPVVSTNNTAAVAVISNIDLKARSPKTMRLNFDLNNLFPGKIISGEAEISFLTKNSTSVSVKVPQHDMSFQISKYKHMSTAFPLPEGLKNEDIDSLRITLLVNKKPVQTETVPFTLR